MGLGLASGPDLSPPALRHHCPLRWAGLEAGETGSGRRRAGSGGTRWPAWLAARSSGSSLSAPRWTRSDGGSSSVALWKETGRAAVGRSQQDLGVIPPGPKPRVGGRGLVDQGPPLTGTLHRGPGGEGGLGPSCPRLRTPTCRCWAHCSLAARRSGPRILSGGIPSPWDSGGGEVARGLQDMAELPKSKSPLLFHPLPPCLHTAPPPASAPRPASLDGIGTRSEGEGAT